MSLVYVAMSGGVDSAAAALLLMQAGHQVRGVTLRLRTHGQEDDLDSARAVAEKLGIPHTVLDQRELFQHTVMDRFVSEYVSGRTPNPCVDCNRCVKFGALLDWVLAQGGDFLATGHYARVDRDSVTGRYLLLRGLDRRKEQSYFLYQLTQHQLSHLLFPVGTHEKPALRELAHAHGFANAHRADSQDICFIPGGDYMTFLMEYGGVTPTPGDFVDAQGRVLGRHKGLERYTTGQRKGLGVSADAPLYVVRKDPESNTVVLGPNSALYSQELIADSFNWISVPTPSAPLSVTAKTRYSQREDEATARALPDGTVQVSFSVPQRAVTPGQAVVLYDGERVVGGGTICKAW